MGIGSHCDSEGMKMAVDESMKLEQLGTRMRIFIIFF